MTVTGQATDPVSPGVEGLPMVSNVPGTLAIGVKGDGGKVAPPPPGVPGPARQAIGVLGTSSDPNGAGVFGSNDAGGSGVHGKGNTGGYFESIGGNGIAVQATGSLTAQSTNPSQPGVLGQPANLNVPGTLAIGVRGDGGSGFPPPPGTPQGVPARQAIGVLGTSADPNDAGVEGENSGGGYGVHGKGAPGGFFESPAKGGVGVSASGVYGLWAKAFAIPGESGAAAGHFETDGSQNAIAIEAINTADADAVNATSSSPNHAALAGHNNGGGYGLWVESDTKSGNVGGIGVYARGATYAAYFDGTVYAKTDVVLGSDCAEDFEIASATEVEPGTVMVLNENGALQPSQDPYDKKVAGVISGAGDYRPGLILGRSTSSQQRMPLALVGKVYCKVDAQYGDIETGDLLTSSPTFGHAMKASEPARAFGAVIGKALCPLRKIKGLIPILIALQ